MHLSPAILVSLASLASIGLPVGTALAQSSGDSPSRATAQNSGHQHGQTSAQAVSARAKPATPVATRPSANLSSPAHAGRAVLIPVTPNTQDASSASTSLTSEPIDLRAPMRFERVFAIGREPGNLRGGTLLSFGGSRVAAASVPLDTSRTQWFARVDGAILALFPRSVYSETSQGTLAEVPAGTIFAIGRPPAHFLGEEAAPMRQASLSDVLESRPIAAPMGQRAQGARPVVARSAEDAASKVPSAMDAVPPLPTNLFRNEEYRAKRVRGLLLQAAKAETDRE